MLVGVVADSPGMERMVGRVLDSRLLDTGMARLLASEELWEMVDEIAQSPAVSDAIAHQSLSFADEMAGEVRTRSRRIDDRLARAARKAFGRRAEGPTSRAAPPLPDAVHVVAAPAAPPRYTGLVTRAIALAIDAALINLVAFVVGAVIALCLSVLPVGGDTEKVVAAISGVVYLIWWGVYFVSFWSTTGQTPGAHVMRFRVHDRASGRIPGVRRSLVRLAGLVLAAIPLCAGLRADPVRREAPRPAGLPRAHGRDRHGRRGRARRPPAAPRRGLITRSGGCAAGAVRLRSRR